LSPYLELMSHCRKLLQRLRLYARLDHDVTSPQWADGEAGCLEGGLNVQAIVRNIGNKLRMGERLIRSAHDSESDVLLSTLHERRNNGMERTLTRHQRVGMSWIQHEQRSAIL